MYAIWQLRPNSVLVSCQQQGLLMWEALYYRNIWGLISVRRFDGGVSEAFSKSAAKILVEESR